MKTGYFTFGQCHEHVIDGVVYDRSCVVRVVSPDPRETMFETFGSKWAMQYDEEPTMSYYPRGIIEHPNNPKE